MVTMVGRDPEWTLRAMATLFAEATEHKMSPILWTLGFFNVRDMIAARGPGYQSKVWSELRPETVWGCGIVVEGLEDRIELIARAGTNERRFKVAGY